MDGRERDGGREVGVSNGSLSPFMCGGHGLWLLFMLVSAQLVLVVVLAIGGPWVVGSDGVHSSMCVDGNGGSRVDVGAGKHLFLLVGPDVSSCHLCGWSGPF